MTRSLLLAALCAVLVLQAAPAQAGGSAKGKVYSNVASAGAAKAGDLFLDYHTDIVDVARGALNISAESAATKVTSGVFSVIGTIFGFALKVAEDPDALKGVKEVVEIHESNEVLGGQFGSVGKDGLDAGFSPAEVRELMGVD